MSISGNGRNLGPWSHDSAAHRCQPDWMAEILVGLALLPTAEIHTDMRHRLIAAISIGLLLLCAGMVVDRLVGASDGTVVQLSNGPFHADRLVVDFVIDSADGLRAGDVVVGVNGARLGPYVDVGPIRVGESLTYVVLRDGYTETIPVTLRAFPLACFLAASWLSLVVLSALLAIATFVFRRRPTDPAAQALLLVAALTFCGTVAYLLGEQVVQLAGYGPTFLDFVGELALALIWGALAYFALVVPGAEIRMTWRRVVALYTLPLALHVVYLAVALPTANGPAEVAGRIAQVSWLPSSVLPVVTALVMAFRYRAIHDVESRQRLRWVLITLLGGALAFLSIWTIPNALGWPVPPTNLIMLLFLPPTLALGAAILRYRLFDIEIILRRSLLYGGLTMSAVAIYLAGAWVLSRVFVTRPTLTAVLASGLVGFIAPPLHAFLRQRVGRLVYGERDDPFEVLARLGRVDAAAAPQEVLQTVVDTLGHALRLPYVHIELRRAQSRFSLAASYGNDSDQSVELPLDLADDVRGRLVLAVGPGREPFGPADRRLLDTVTRHVSRAASMVLLTTELQLSREQIVLAREEERRRLHHRLHDGLGPDLAAGVMRMEAARELMSRDADAAAAHLDEQIVRTRSLIGDVRRLVYNLRPPALDQLGLADAIRERANQLLGPNEASRMRIRVEHEGSLAELPAAVEVAAFWISVEATSNAVRHAEASLCRIRLVRGTALMVKIEDDGRGIPDRVQAGGGLISMRERAEELGGTCRIRRTRDHGTVVEAQLPIRTVVTG